VTSNGTVVPLNLSHRVIAQLVGARRPTVSTAMAELARSGAIQRLDSGGWLLVGEPVGVPTNAARRTILMRRQRSRWDGWDAAAGEPQVQLQASGVGPTLRAGRDV
jgi:hypothetical protein